MTISRRFPGPWQRTDTLLSGLFLGINGVASELEEQWTILSRIEEYRYSIGSGLRYLASAMGRGGLATSLQTYVVRITARRGWCAKQSLCLYHRDDQI